MNQVNEGNLSRVTTCAGVAGLCSIARLVLAYTSTVLITRSIGSELYGVFLLGFTVISLSQVFSTLGLPDGLLRFVAFYKGDFSFTRRFDRAHRRYQPARIAFIAGQFGVEPFG